MHSWCKCITVHFAAGVRWNRRKSITVTLSVLRQRINMGLSSVRNINHKLNFNVGQSTAILLFVRDVEYSHHGMLHGTNLSFCRTDSDKNHERIFGSRLYRTCEDLLSRGIISFLFSSLYHFSRFLGPLYTSVTSPRSFRISFPCLLFVHCTIIPLILPQLLYLHQNNFDT
jgi:hypothetical protein